MFRAYIKQKIKQLDRCLAIPPEEIDWPQLYENCRWLLAEVEQRATLAGLPEAVKACQMQDDMATPEEVRQALAACLAAIPEPAPPVLLTVQQAAARYNMGERTLYRLLERGALRNCGHGKSKRIKPADLERLGISAMGFDSM